ARGGDRGELGADVGLEDVGLGEHRAVAGADATCGSSPSTRNARHSEWVSTAWSWTTRTRRARVGPPSGGLAIATSRSHACATTAPSASIRPSGWYGLARKQACSSSRVASRWSASARSLRDDALRDERDDHTLLVQQAGHRLEIGVVGREHGAHEALVGVGLDRAA